VEKGGLPINDEDDKWLEEPMEEEYPPVSPKILPGSAVNWESSLVKSFIAEKDVEKKVDTDKPKLVSSALRGDLFDDDFDMDAF
jgi:hypothetical protein